MFNIKFDMDIDGLQKQIQETARAHVQDTLSAIRHPDTGEFPIVNVILLEDGNLNVEVRGSDALIALVHERFQEEFGTSAPAEQAMPDEQVASSPAVDTVPPRAFLSFAYEDFELAKAVATHLMDMGIDTWWADWEIKAGDSLRQKIDAGLGGCTHFIALLTPQSLPKPWVQQELDAGLIRKLNYGAKLIALRSGLAVSQLPPLLQGQNSPSVDPADFDLTQLVNDIHGVSRKPALGSVPPVVTKAKQGAIPYSAGACAVAQLFVEQSPKAFKYQPMLAFATIADATGLTVDDVRDGVHELRGLLSVHRSEQVYPEEELFARMDQFWRDWDAEADALEVASALVNGIIQGDPAEIAQHFGWEARRLNPALSFLSSRNLVRSLRSMSGRDYVLATLVKTDETRRFVKSRQS